MRVRRFRQEAKSERLIRFAEHTPPRPTAFATVLGGQRGCRALPPNYESELAAAKLELEAARADALRAKVLRQEARAAAAEARAAVEPHNVATSDTASLSWEPWPTQAQVHEKGPDWWDHLASMASVKPVSVPAASEKEGEHDEYYFHQVLQGGSAARGAAEDATTRRRSSTSEG